MGGYTSEEGESEGSTPKKVRSRRRKEPTSTYNLGNEYFLNAVLIGLSSQSRRKGEIL